MNRLLDSLNAVSVVWVPWIWRACWQSAVVVGVAWLLCTLLVRLSPWLRSWIWRLAYIKILLLLVWPASINLPLLPAAEESFKEPPLAATATSHPAPENVTTPTEAVVASTSKNAVSEVESGAEASLAKDPRPVARDATLPSPLTGSEIETFSIFFLVWVIGAVVVLGWFAVETRRAFRLYRTARRIESPALESLVADVCAQLGLRPRVQLAESPLAGGPMLVKFLRPLIIFPHGMLLQESSLSMREGQPNPASSPSPSTGEGRGEGEELTCGQNPSQDFASSLTPDEIRLILAHELAHIRRRDLAWNALAAFVHTVLYFHPLVWFAHRCSRQEQELACDELVVTRLGVERHAYGQLLVKIVRQVGRQLHSAVATVAMSKSYQTLSRRIDAGGPD